MATWSNLSNDELAARQDESGLRILPWGRKITPLAWTFLNRPRIESWLDKNTDLLHLSALGFPVATRLPLVATIHDLGPLTHPELFSIAPPWLLRRSLKQAIDQAVAIICVSQATADESVAYCSKHYSIDISNRITVIHEGVEESFFSPPGSECLNTLPDLPDAPFLLMAGAISPRKNVQGVLTALEQIKDQIDHRLVVVGGGGWDTEAVQEQLRTSGLHDRVHLLGYVTQEQLQALYGRATAFLYPSLFEGFGLTVLEAMAAGCPVVTSNVFSLPEVAGDAALLVNPHSPDQIRDAIVQVCSDDSLATDLSLRGTKRARQFSWTRCAIETHSVYQSVLQGR